MKNVFYKNKSAIHGYGMFSKVVFSKEDIIYNIPSNFCSNTPKPRRAHVGNGIWIGDKYMLDNVNHSCNPNALLSMGSNPFLKALRNIGVGEEITVGYNNTEIGGKKVTCSCGYRYCKKNFLRIEPARKVGIIGGIGPESSAIFYKRIIERVQDQGVTSNTDYPHIVLESIPAPELLLEDPDLSMYKNAVRNLEYMNVDFIILVCNTAYVFFDYLKSNVITDFIDLNNEVDIVLRQSNVKSIVILGSQKVIESLFVFDNIEIIRIAQVDRIILDEIILSYNIGKNNNFLQERLLEIIRKYRTQCEHILIACTELSMMLKGKNAIPYFDTFDILLDATLNSWRGLKETS